MYSPVTSKFLSSLTFISCGSHTVLVTDTIYDNRSSCKTLAKFDANVFDSVISSISKIANLYISFFDIKPLSRTYEGEVTICAASHMATPEITDSLFFIVL